MYVLSHTLFTMECPVCYGDDCACHTLTCGHNICKTCVKQWFVAASQEPDCPMCRAPLNFRGLHRVREKWEEEASEKRIEEYYGNAIDNAIDDWIEDLPSMCIHAIRAVEHNFKEISHLIHDLSDDALEVFLDSNNVVSFPSTRYMEWNDFTTRRYLPSKHSALRVGRPSNYIRLM